MEFMYNKMEDHAPLQEGENNKITTLKQCPL